MALPLHTIFTKWLYKMVYTSLFMSFSINENSNAFHSYFKNE